MEVDDILKNVVGDYFEDVLDGVANPQDLPVVSQPAPVPTKVEEPAEVFDSQSEEDFNTARRNLRDIVDRGAEALDELLSLAKDSQHPHAFQALSELIRTLAQTNRDLITIHKEIKDINKKKEDPEIPAGTTVNNNTTNAIFVGTTDELDRWISKKLCK